MIQMIVMDMDGTLLTSDNTISPKTKEMLLQVQKQGVRLVLASGRSYCKLLEYAKELQMDTYGGYLQADGKKGNGGNIYLLPTVGC